MTHPAIEEIEELIVVADLDGAKRALLALLGTQIEGAPSTADARPFKALRSEALLHASQLSHLKTVGRLSTQPETELATERRRVTHALVTLLTEIDETLERSISPKPAPAPTMDPHLSAAIPEKVYGRGNLQSIAWLARGVEAGKSVCRIITPTSLGTGFITPNGRIITNNHVVPDKETAAKTRIEFNFERDGDGNLQPSKMYHASDLDFFTLPEPWDCTVMAVADPCDDMGQWGALAPSNSETPVLGDPVTIIQHPNGGEKQIAVTANEVVAISQGKLAYLTDTLGGSSGSPVFNERWEVVALHRAGGALVPTQEGATLRANEGVLFSGLFTLPEFCNALGRSL